MKYNKEHLWQACIDGELSTAEASEFEQSLSADESELLAADIRFERALAEKLGEPVACPDEVWRHTLDRLRENIVDFRPRRRAPRWLWGAVSLAAAASIAFMVSLQFVPGASHGSSQIVMAAASVDELAALSMTEATPGAVSAFLSEHAAGLDFQLEAAMAGHPVADHTFELIGVGTETVAGEEVTEVYFDCCGYPVKMLLAERGSAAAMTIGNALGNGSDILATRAVGRYLATVVGKHSSNDLLNLVRAEL